MFTLWEDTQQISLIVGKCQAIYQLPKPRGDAEGYAGELMNNGINMLRGAQQGGELIQL